MGPQYYSRLKAVVVKRKQLLRKHSSFKTFLLRKHSYFDTFQKASCDAEKLCLCYFSLSLSFYIPVFYCFFTIFFYPSKPFQRPRSCNSIICKKCYKNDKKLH